MNRHLKGPSRGWLFIPLALMLWLALLFGSGMHLTDLRLKPPSAIAPSCESPDVTLVSEVRSSVALAGHPVSLRVGVHNRSTADCMVPVGCTRPSYQILDAIMQPVVEPPRPVTNCHHEGATRVRAFGTYWSPWGIWTPSSLGLFTVVETGEYPDAGRRWATVLVV